MKTKNLNLQILLTPKLWIEPIRVKRFLPDSFNTYPISKIIDAICDAQILLNIHMAENFTVLTDDLKLLISMISAMLILIRIPARNTEEVSPYFLLQSQVNTIIEKLYKVHDMPPIFKEIE